MNAVVDLLNLIFWNCIVIYGLLAVGLFFAIRFGCLQFRHLGEWFRCVVGPGEVDKNGITPLQALTVSHSGPCC